MNRSELKSNAKQQIKGKIGILFVISLIIATISGIASLILSAIPVVGGLASAMIVTPAFLLSTYRIYLNLTNDTTPSAGDSFCGFDDFWSAFKVNFLTGLFTFLWSLLFVIPGIIKGYSYSMSMYILAENKGKPALECIDESKAMTNGHKMDLFVLDLSFIGWILLGCITFGIALIWVYPYMNATYANVYNSLKPVKAETANEPEVILSLTEPVSEETTEEEPVTEKINIDTTEEE